MPTTFCFEASLSRALRARRRRPNHRAARARGRGCAIGGTTCDRGLQRHRRTLDIAQRNLPEKAIRVAIIRRERGSLGERLSEEHGCLALPPGNRKLAAIVPIGQSDAPTSPSAAPDRKKLQVRRHGLSEETCFGARSGRWGRFAPSGRRERCLQVRSMLSWARFWATVGANSPLWQRVLRACRAADRSEVGNEACGLSVAEASFWFVKSPLRHHRAASKV